MILPSFSPPTWKLILEQADAQNVKRSGDIEPQGRLILTAPDGSRHALVVSSAGVLSTVAA